jgi:hypothetical protein
MVWSEVMGVEGSCSLSRTGHGFENDRVSRRTGNDLHYPRSRVSKDDSMRKAGREEYLRR